MKKLGVLKLIFIMLVVPACKDAGFIGEREMASIDEGAEVIEEIVEEIEVGNEDLEEAVEINEEEVSEVEEEEAAETPINEFSYIPFTWDGKHEDSDLWSEYTHEAINTYGEDLLKSQPEDIDKFCPNYKSLNEEGRLMFWIHLISSMTKYESSFRPWTKYKENFKDSEGNYIYSRGLLQISIESGRGYGCKLNSGEDLHDPQKNLECGVRILNRWVGRDGVVGLKNSEGKWKGGARYWAVLRKRSSSQSYDRIRNLTQNSEVCKL